MDNFEGRFPLARDKFSLGGEDFYGAFGVYKKGAMDEDHLERLRSKAERALTAFKVFLVANPHLLTETTTDSEDMCQEEK